MSERRRGQFPPRGWFGVGLIALCWPLNWLLPGLRTHVFFFPLWLGYVLVVDGFVYRRTGTSEWSRSKRQFAALFLASVPIWWFFELINAFTHNWHYEGREAFSDLEYAVLGSIAFSVVLPAVSETAELLLSARWIKRLSPGPCWGASARSRWLTFCGGLALFAFLFCLPRNSYAATWVAPGLVLMPVVQWMKRPGSAQRLSRGDWRPIVAYAFAALICGFFWELWNAYAYPRWVYSIPGFDQFPHLFAMPLPGYLGYLPFGVTLAFCADLVGTSLDPRPAPAHKRHPDDTLS